MSNQVERLLSACPVQHCFSAVGMRKLRHQATQIRLVSHGFSVRGMQAKVLGAILHTQDDVDICSLPLHDVPAV